MSYTTTKLTGFGPLSAAHSGLLKQVNASKTSTTDLQAKQDAVIGVVNWMIQASKDNLSKDDFTTALWEYLKGQEEMEKNTADEEQM
jgi:hypothetical protein